MPLPVESVLPELAAALADRTTAILVAAPGAGKTTRVPLALLDAPWLQGRRIVMLEPRRLAARAAASRMAQTLGEPVGATAGYTVRLEQKTSAQTRIEVVTEGILTRRMQRDASLDNTGLLIFDEFHERSLDGDLALALALDVQRGLREDLRILVMSATLDLPQLIPYLGGAPVISAPGRQFPVETRYRDAPDRRALARDMAQIIRTVLPETQGGILAFLPGEAEIRRCAAALGEMALPDRVRVYPLYGAMPLGDQDEAIRPASPGTCKVVLATTIAETSLTIDGIDIVIDGGLKRSPRFDPASGMTALETVRVSQASADQRRGRAGRQRPGVCYRLWPEAEMRALLPHDPPEILIADLAPLALELAAWGVADPRRLSWIDPPPAAAYAQARDLLAALDAVDTSGAITAMGKRMAALPLHPRLAHMVVAGGELGAGKLAADLAALLSERDTLRRESGADIALRLQAFRRGHERIMAAARQIRAIAGSGIDTDPDLAPGILIALAWPERVAQARGARGRYRLAGGGGAMLDEDDPLAREKYLAVATTDGSSGDQRIYLAAALSLADIEHYFASHIAIVESLAWDGREEAVTARRRTMLGALILHDQKLEHADPAALAGAMLRGVREMGLEALPWSDAARNLLTRVRFLRRHFPDAGWPDFGDSALLAAAEDWLLPYLAGITRRSHLARLDMLQILRSAVPHALQRSLDGLAPTHFTIPSGAAIAIDYEGDGDPVLRARLQEMFGLMDTPRIAGGAVPLRIELLSPARRPLAVTQDLTSFWKNAYPQVRSEMRGRYPKHKWPDDPLAATPVQPRKLR
ncbi:ATP-dependent helicase HrpB [soil metagenome]